MMKRRDMWVGRCGAGQRGSVVLGLLGLLASLVLALVMAVVGLFRFDRDAAVLRDTVMSTSGVQWEKQVQVGVGSLPFGLARLAMSCVEVEPELRAFVNTVRGVDVGVFECGGEGVRERRVVLAKADAAMERRGWYRVVGVQDGGDLVAIYTAANARAEKDLQLCLVVLEERQMVVVSARCNPAPLLDLVENGQLRGAFGGVAFR